MTNDFRSMPLASDWLSIIGLLLTLVGFSITIFAAFRAKSAAESARAAASSAANIVRRLDVIGELATVIQLIEELKRLQRSRAVDLLPDRYASVRGRLISIRQYFSDEKSQEAIQDVVARIASLQRAYDRNASIFDDAKAISKSNDSLSNSIDALLKIQEEIKINLVVSK
jgi:hypothetical protein